jgi:hypothetical protein
LLVKVCAEMPEMINAACFPSLQHLVVECDRVTTSMVQCLAQLTTLTCLQLSSGAIFYRTGFDSSEGWCGLEDLGDSLLLLRRLELVSCFGSKDVTADIHLPLLVMPILSTFTQLKQLQLACTPHPRKILPDQPSPADFLAGLSELTQLEQLEVLGYSSVNPGLLTDLVTCLPGLRALEVGLSRHSSLMQAEGQQAGGTQKPGASSGFYGDGCELLPVHQGFAQASKACEGLRPGLRVQLGYTPKWLP